MRVCDLWNWGFALTCKFFPFNRDCGRALMKFETSIIAGVLSGFGVKPRSKVCCLWYSQLRFLASVTDGLTRSRSFSICIRILYFEFKTDRRAMGQNFGIPLISISTRLPCKRRLT